MAPALKCFLVFCTLLWCYGHSATDSSNSQDSQSDSSSEDDEERYSLVETSYGWIRGIINDMGRSFTSIPYGQPPTPENDLRFRNPLPADSWDGILNATTVAPVCMQSDCDERSITCYKSTPAEMSEDCLYLNLYTPPQNDDCEELLPTILYIHGGSYMSQWSGSDLYDGQKMAYLNNVIVVTINYRLGSFGYYYDPRNDFDGNYGYFDQILALQFVYDNIEQFGGDQSKITLMGESAGAQSVATLLMDSSNDMYSGAIMLSEPMGLPFRTSDSWQNVAQTYVESANCTEDTESCMRNERSAEELMSAQLAVQSDLFAFCKWFKCYWIFTFEPWTPTFETDALPQQQPLKAFQDGEYNKVPIIMGQNDDEGVSFVYGLVSAIFGDYSHGLCRAQYKMLIYAIMGVTYGDQIIAEYRDAEPDCVGADYRPLLSRIAGEFWFVCPSRNATMGISQYSDVWKYNYNYLYVFDPPESMFGENVYCQGVDENICHGVQLPVMLGPETVELTKRDVKLSNLIQKYFTNLARDGDVGEDWTQFLETSNEWSMTFTDNGKGVLESNYEQNNDFNCDFWDDMGYPQLWWQDSPFSSPDLEGIAKVFGNATFRQQLNTNDTCTNTSDETASMFVAEERSGETSVSKNKKVAPLYMGVTALSQFMPKHWGPMQIIVIEMIVFLVCFMGLGVLVGISCSKKEEVSMEQNKAKSFGYK